MLSIDSIVEARYSRVLGWEDTSKLNGVPHSQPKIWRKTLKIGFVRTLRTLAFWMYGWEAHWAARW